MKRIFLFAALLFSLFAQAQNNVIFNTGSAGRVTIDNQDYERGYITYRWYLSGSDTLVELAREYNTSQPFRSGRVISKYKDGDNASAAFASFAAWRTWWRSNGEPKPDTIVGGGGVTSITAGTGLSGGTITTTGTVAVDQSTAFVWTGANTWTNTSGNTYNINNNTTTIKPAVIISNTTAATGGATRQNSPALSFRGTGWSGSASQLMRMDMIMKPSTVSGRYDFSFDQTIGGVTTTGVVKISQGGSLSATTLVAQSGGLTTNNSPIYNNAVQTPVSGSTSGDATFTMPEQGTSHKKVIIYLNALLGTASYTFDAPFFFTPAIITTDGVAAAVVTSLSTSAVTVTGATTTGFLILEGY